MTDETTPELRTTALTPEQLQRAEALEIATRHVRRPALFGNGAVATAKPLIDLADYIITGFTAELVIGDEPAAGSPLPDIDIGGMSISLPRVNPHGERRGQY